MILAPFVLCKDEIVRWRCSSLDEAVLMWVCWGWWFISYWVRCSFSWWFLRLGLTRLLFKFLHTPFTPLFDVLVLRTVLIPYLLYYLLAFIILCSVLSFERGITYCSTLFTYPVVDSFDTFVTCYNLFVFLTMFIFLRSCLWRFTFTRWSYPLLRLLVVVL